MINVDLMGFLPASREQKGNGGRVKIIMALTQGNARGLQFHRKPIFFCPLVKHKTFGRYEIERFVPPLRIKF